MTQELQLWSPISPFSREHSCVLCEEFSDEVGIYVFNITKYSLPDITVTALAAQNTISEGICGN